MSWASSSLKISLLDYQEFISVRRFYSLKLCSPPVSTISKEVSCYPRTSLSLAVSMPLPVVCLKDELSTNVQWDSSAARNSIGRTQPPATGIKELLSYSLFLRKSLQLLTACTMLLVPKSSKDHYYLAKKCVLLSGMQPTRHYSSSPAEALSQCRNRSQEQARNSLLKHHH